MTRFFTLLTGLLLFVSCNTADRRLRKINLQLLTETVDISSQELGNDTQGLSFRVREMDFGHVCRGEVIDTVFQFRNTTPQPVVIIKAITGCSCTKVKFDSAPIPADSSSWVTVSFEADSDGAFFKKILLYTSAGSRPIELSIQGTVD